MLLRPPSQWTHHVRCKHYNLIGVPSGYFRRALLAWLPQALAVGIALSSVWAGTAPEANAQESNRQTLRSALQGVGAPPVQEGAPGELSSFEVDQILEQLRMSPTATLLLGKLIRNLELSGPRDLGRVLRWSDVSRTDALLTRHFDPIRQVEIRKREILIYLKRHPSFAATLLDLVHELTHAAHNPAWDPYDPTLSAHRYIRTTLEGPGGEVDAVSNECLAGLELGISRGKLKTGKDRCADYVEAGGKVSRSKIQRDFYAVGKFKQRLEKEVESGLPQLSDSEPLFFSSTGNAPYPVSLYQEYLEINQITCRNSMRRVRALAAAESVQSDQRTVRSPTPLRAVEAFIRQRCTSRGVLQ